MESILIYQIMRFLVIEPFHTRLLLGYGNGWLASIWNFRICFEIRGQARSYLETDLKISSMRAIVCRHMDNKAVNLETRSGSHIIAWSAVIRSIWLANPGRHTWQQAPADT